MALLPNSIPEEAHIPTPTRAIGAFQMEQLFVLKQTSRYLALASCAEILITS
jgi:hypothetical protein